jgi:spermidine synthase
VKVELIRDALRDSGWWLLVGGSEQSFVDTADPTHLEFEYVQMMANVLEVMFPTDAPVDAVHLGGGLCTVPRWLAERHPGSRQQVAERSERIAGLSASIGDVAGTTVVIDEALAVLTACRPHRADLVVCDVYEGPETVTSLFAAPALNTAYRALRRGGLYLCNVSDAKPFDLSRVVAATLRSRFASVVLQAEPAVLRGRRSGNLVLAGSDRPIPVAAVSKQAAGTSVRTRVVGDDDLASFVGTATPVEDAAALPMSGESLGLRLIGRPPASAGDR